MAYQGSVLGPLLFLIYINDLMLLCQTHSDIYVFADDAKLFRHILNVNDCDTLREELLLCTTGLKIGY